MADMTKFDGSAAAVRANLDCTRPFSQWPLAVRFLETLPADATPVAVAGSTSYAFDNRNVMRMVAATLGRMLRGNPQMVLVTGGMPAVGQDVGTAFCQADPAPAPLYNLLPVYRGELTPLHGTLVETGQTFQDRQFVLGMAARIIVLIGGGPGAAREANVSLKCGGVVLPIACSGGAAAGKSFGLHDPLQDQVHLETSKRQAIDHRLVSAEHWDAIADPDGVPERVVRIVCHTIERLGAR
jgi:hypothetical protein